MFEVCEVRESEVLLLLRHLLQLLRLLLLSTKDAAPGRVRRSGALRA